LWEAAQDRAGCAFSGKVGFVRGAFSFVSFSFVRAKENEKQS